jgi:2-phospho-L-lactate guanylyltransferase
MIPALVPVKRLAAAKSRLLPELGREGARELALALLADVIAPLRAARGIGPVVVVTEDPEAAAAARGAGARALLRPDPGLNEAIERAAAELAAEGATALLVVLGDVAGATARDVEALVAALSELGGRGVVIAPSRDGGTSALLRAPHDVIAAAFGPQSADAHRRLAERARVPLRVLALPSLALDVDSADDLRALLRAAEGGAHVRRAARALGLEPAC